MSKKFMVLTGDANKTASQKYDEMEVFFAGRFSHIGPGKPTKRFAPDGITQPRLVLTDGSIAFPVPDDCVQYLPNAPHKFPTPVTFQSLASRIPRSRIDDVVNPLAQPIMAATTNIPAPGASFWQRHKWKLAAGATAAAATGAAVAHYFFGVVF